MKRNAKIAAAAMYVPDRCLPNSWFNELLGEDVDTWLQENLTIRERRWCAEDESSADLAEGAARRLLQKTNVTASDLDLIIISTDTPEYISPSTASVVQHRLGAVNAGTFDVNSACAGFVTILDMGSKYIRSDEKYNNVLLIGTYAMSKYLDLQDKKTVTLFADGAAAVLLQATDEDRGFVDALLHTEGQYHDWMGIYGGGTHMPPSQASLEHNAHVVKFVHKFPKELNPQTWTRMITKLMRRQNLQPRDIDFALFTQININSIQETMANLGLPMERTQTVMDRYAYTGSACIPMALTEAMEAGKIKAGDRVIFMGSGGGLAFACALFTF